MGGLVRAWSRSPPASAATSRSSSPGGVPAAAASFGSTVTLEVDGPDEVAAMAAMVQLFDTGLQPRR
jgi:phosphotransferase system HPr-like phosphotransfer protein